MALVENIQRQDLDPIEIALSYQRLIDEINLTQEQMSTVELAKNVQPSPIICVCSNLTLSFKPECEMDLSVWDMEEL